MDQHVILFDGDCAFCNGWVKWIMRRDPGKRFRFAPLASEEGVALRRKHGVPDTVDSIVLVQEEGVFTKSDAAWRVLRALPGWGFAGLLLRLIPGPLRNWGYDLIARNRHRLGMKDTCQLPGQRH